MIINSLKSLDDTVPQDFIEPRHRPPSVQKISEILDKSPKHIKKDLVSLLPKLVDRSEHPLAASALLDQLRKPDTDPVLQLPVRHFSLLLFPIIFSSLLSLHIYERKTTGKSIIGPILSLYHRVSAYAYSFRRK